MRVALFLFAACALSCASSPPASPAMQPSARTTSADAAPSARKQAPVQECAALRERIDRADSEANSVDTSDPRAFSETLTKVEAVLDAAAKDLDALDASDEAVRALGHDYATQVRSVSEQLRSVNPLAEQMSAAARKVRASEERAGAARTACAKKKAGGKCKAAKAAQEQLEVDMAAFLTATRDIQEFAHEPHNQEVDAAVRARDADLKRRLTATCGAP